MISDAGFGNEWKAPLTVRGSIYDLGAGSVGGAGATTFAAADSKCPRGYY